MKDDSTIVTIESIDSNTNKPIIFNYVNIKDGFSAKVKSDGCIHFYRNYGDDKPDYIHICDLDKTINVLKEIKKSAKFLFYSDEAWKNQ